MSIFDSGEGYESVQSAETEVVETPVETDSTTDAAPTELSVEEPQVQAEQEALATTEERPAKQTETPSEDEVAKLEQEVEKALADERTPKWFKNAVENVYKPKLTELTEKLGTYEPLSDYGTVEEIGQKVALANSLETVRSNPQTGMPELTTEPFVKQVYEKDPKVAYQLLNDLSNLPSPFTQGWNVLHEILKGSGIDPSRLEDHKTFAANGYQLQESAYPQPDAEELALIPEHLRNTFSNLSPERRNDLLATDEEIRNQTLEDIKVARDAKQRETAEAKAQESREAEEKAAKEREFLTQVDQKGTENFIKSGDAVFTSFVDSLAKHMSKMDALGIANTVLSSFEPTVQGRQSLEALKADGIVIDPIIPQTLTQLEEVGRHIAYYELVNDRASMEKAVARQVELQEKLIAKGNKIVAALALKKAKAVAQPLQDQNNALAANLNSRYAAAGVGTTVNGNTPLVDDFEDSAYLADLHSTGFGRR